MTSSDEVESLAPEECRELLRAGNLGRLAATAAGEIDIFPVNYVSDGTSILIRTAAGTKLLELTIHEAVAFEIDGHDADAAWSVIVHGRARQLEQRADIEAAEVAALESWMPTPKYRYVRIEIDRLTGLRFRMGGR